MGAEGPTHSPATVASSYARGDSPRRAPDRSNSVAMILGCRGKAWVESELWGAGDPKEEK